MVILQPGLLGRAFCVAMCMFIAVYGSLMHGECKLSAWWNTKEDKPELILVLLIALMLGMCPSSEVHVELSDRLIRAATVELEWPKSMWNSYYESSEEKYD